MNPLGGLLAIDLGARLAGWAYYRDAALVQCGTWDIEPPRGSSIGIRWLRFVAHLDTLADANPVDIVAYEQVSRHEGTSAAHAYGGAKSHLEAWIARRRGPDLPPDQGLQVTSVTVADVKLAAVGKGGGPGTDKAAVHAAAEARWPDHFRPGKAPEFDRADAAFIGRAALMQLGAIPRPAPALKAPKARKTPRHEAPSLF
jgi:hypothetical protein